MADYDRGYKLLFSSPEMVRDLLLGFVREDWVAKLDFNSLEKVAGSYISDDLRERHDDVIWRVRFADKWLYLYILLEFQSTEDIHMSVRVLTYLGLLYQDLIRGKQFTPSGKLPPVLPIVLYNGDKRWSAAEEVSELIEHIPGSLARFSPKLRYLLIDEGAYEHTELESLKNLVATLFQLEKTPMSEVANELLYKFIEWVWDNKELQRAVAVFLTRVYF
ncbi:MAG: Rpn family recombination-promoting nuclease/putative transposase, partial [Proteobacteria bacterium]|nr:Rpn family recombination-promoting nuclease/putative transposase [Pseudomonadota bacterium]